MTLETLFSGILRGEWIWCAKRLSVNDVGLNHSHQAGIYLPAFFVRRAFGDVLEKSTELNPRVEIPYVVIGRENVCFSPLSVIYYNNRKVAGGTRDEFRVTRWRQGKICAYDVSDCNSVILLAVSRAQPKRMVVYIARTEEEEVMLQERLGYDALAPGDIVGSEENPGFSDFDIPDAWRTSFPSSQDISDFVFNRLCPWGSYATVDHLLLARRSAEQELFTRLEQIHSSERIAQGFRTTEEFTQYALAVLNRRKARSGKSLEHNLTDIFMRAKVSFSAQAKTEQNKRPDFLFPSATRYHDPFFPASHLYMMGAKTTCKDRWRQILSEANRIDSPFLFTLDTAITDCQYEEMCAAKVRLVMPAPLLAETRASIRSGAMTLTQFVNFQLAEQTLFR